MQKLYDQFQQKALLKHKKCDILSYLYMLNMMLAMALRQHSFIKYAPMGGLYFALGCRKDIAILFVMKRGQVLSSFFLKKCFLFKF